MLRAYKYRLYPTPAQEQQFAQHFGAVRWMYNHALERRIEHYQETKKMLSRYDIQKTLPTLKKENQWLAEVNSQSVQSAIFALDAAYTRFFREKKGFPKFKSRHESYQSFQCPQSVRVDFETGRIRLPKIKSVKAKLHRSFVGQIKTCTVSRTPTGKYYISVLVEDGNDLPAPKRPKEKATIGIDLGLKDFATLSTGEKVENPKEYRKLESKLRYAHRQLSKKKKGSANREKAKLRVALIHEKIAARRADFLHKLTSRIVAENQSIAIEDLNVDGMKRNRRLSKSISDAGWGEFRRQLDYKCAWYGKNLLTIGRFEPSSRLCTCGAINRELTLADRKWTCSECGATHDRDILAAQNIVRMAFHPKQRRGSPLKACGAAGISRSVEAGSPAV